MRTPNFATVNDRNKICYFMTLSAAKFWGSHTCRREYLILRVSRRLPGCLIPLGKPRRKGPVEPGVVVRLVN